MHTKNTHPKVARRAAAAARMDDLHLAAIILHMDNPDLRASDFEEMPYAPMYGEGKGFEVDGEEWAVCTEDEANAAWEQSLDSYLDECVMPEVPESMHAYFDEDAWKRDARMDGRGHSLSSYDGEEREQIVETDDGRSEWFYLYRVN